MTQGSELAGLDRLFETIGNADFFPTLVQWLGGQAPHDGPAIILFHKDHAPVSVFDALTEADNRVFASGYMKGAYLLDPFYIQCDSGAEGLFLIRDIAPKGFFSSSYYKRYFAPANMQDEAAYVLQLGKGVSCQISLSRSKSIHSYTKRAVKALTNCYALVASAVKKHFMLTGLPFGTTQAAKSAASLQARLDEFGRNELTIREHEIAHLMLRGFSSKASANILEISPQTERVHRKNIYKKMEVNSHAELLAEAFHFLMDEDVSPAN